MYLRIFKKKNINKRNPENTVKQITIVRLISKVLSAFSSREDIFKFNSPGNPYKSTINNKI